MISHTIPASGIAGVIKLALSLYHRVLPPTLNVDRAEPQARARADALLHQHRDAAVDPRRRRAASRRRQRVRLRRHQRPRRARGGCRPGGRSTTCRRGRARSSCSQADSPPALVAGRRRELRRVRLDAEPTGVALADLAYSLNCGSRRMPRRRAARGRRDVVRRPARRSSTAPIEKLEAAGLPAHQGHLRASTSRPSRSGARGRSSSSSPARARSTRTCSPTSACTSRRCGRSFDRVDRLYRDDPRGYVTSDWVFPRPAFSDDERRTRRRSA